MMRPNFITKSYKERIPGDPNHDYHFMDTEDPKTGIKITFEKFPYAPYMAAYKNIHAYGADANYKTGDWRINIYLGMSNGDTEFLDQVKSTSKAEVFKLAHLKMVELANDQNVLDRRK